MLQIEKLLKLNPIVGNSPAYKIFEGGFRFSDLWTHVSNPNNRWADLSPEDVIAESPWADEVNRLSNALGGRH